MTTSLSSILPTQLQTRRLTLELYNSTQSHIDCYLLTRNGASTPKKTTKDPGCFDQQDLGRRHGAVKLDPHEFTNEIDVDTFILYLMRLDVTETIDTLAASAAQPVYIGFAHVHQHPESPPEIGYKLMAQFMGRGYATEAVNGIVECCTQTLSLRRMAISVPRSNVASRRVAEKVGFSATGEYKVLENEEVLDWYSFPVGKV